MRLHRLFTDHMILQRDLPLRFWGEDAPGATIHVSIADRAEKSVADAKGRWSVELPPLPAGGPHELTVAGTQTVCLHDVMVGEVYVASGQSNMEMRLRGTTDWEREAATADVPGIRLLTIPTCAAEQPADEPPAAAWTRCTPRSAADFSAVAYYFARHLQCQLHVPVGIIAAAVGNTPAESWVARSVLDADADFAPILDRWKKSLAAGPDGPQVYAQAFAKWDHDADLAEREGRPIPGPFPKLVSLGNPWTPSGLFNGMIHPLARFPLRGVIWYQGAGAPDRGHQYRKLFRGLIRNWRDTFAQPDLPFLFVQEPAFGPRRDQPCEHSWAELREAQALALAEPHTAMAVSMDCGDEKNIHPPLKKPIGDRLALAARAIVYGQDVPYSGPVFASMTREGSRLRLHFTHTAGSLRTPDGRPPVGFAVSPGATDFSAGNRNFVWANAKIEGDDLLVWADSVPHPVAVRYAWAQNPDCNLVNAAGLPASPFRTDDWPGVTFDVR